MSSGQFNAGQSQAQSQAKTEQWVDSAKSTAEQAHDKAHHAVGHSDQHTQQTKEENAGILQQTGEQVAHMAQGAIDGVKNTLGMGEKKN
ncbi:late embryogenesis abundant protein D-7 [Andrographis paniculata]|uniref:late embryogenesis abundant protein D-7 n=1 Tax=Andrographis paniculata TaxID=175694 RepID=UPI0021E99336|nr:late embryogenesis abundant protein D-7 [Andrographis paniculata]